MIRDIRKFIWVVRCGTPIPLTRYIDSGNKVLSAVLIIGLLGLALRFYGIDNPLLDSHAERQAQAAMVARNLYHGGMNWWCTRLDMFGTGNTCHLMEFPVMQIIVAMAYSITGETTVVGRLIAIAFSIGSIGFFYGIARYHLNGLGIVVAVAIYALSPFSVYFGRAFMAESSMMFFSLASLYFVLRYFESSRNLFYCFAIVTGALAVLAKPTVVIILFPIVAVWVRSFGYGAMKKRSLWIYLIMACIPEAIWVAYSWIQPNQDIPESWHLLSIVFDRGGIFSMWIDPRFYTQVGGSILLGHLTSFGLILACIGVLGHWRNESSVVICFWIMGVVAYLLLLAGANTGHIYYQLPVLPLGCLLAGMGAEFIAKNTLFSKTTIAMLIPLSLSSIMGYGFLYYSLGSYMYDVDRRMPHTLEVSRIVSQSSKDSEWFVVNQPRASTSVVTYLADRESVSMTSQGSMEDIQTLEKFRDQGASLFVVLDTSYGSGMKESQSNETFWYYLNEEYRAIALQEHYAVFDIRVQQ